MINVSSPNLSMLESNLFGFMLTELIQRNNVYWQSNPVIQQQIHDTQILTASAVTKQVLGDVGGCGI